MFCGVCRRVCEPPPRVPGRQRSVEQHLSGPAILTQRDPPQHQREGQKRRPHRRLQSGQFLSTDLEDGLWSDSFILFVRVAMFFTNRLCDLQDDYAINKPQF